MEVLGFYWANIIAGCILVFVLGHIGRHLIARGQSMEIMLLGQEFQTSILIGAIILFALEKGEHVDHGIHLESIFALVFVLIFHSLYSLLVKKHRSFRVEGAIGSIILLMGLSQLIVLTSPIVEFHMVKSFLGDIVTVSLYESVGVAILSLLIGVIFYRNQAQIMQDTIEIALFNRPTKKRATQLLFNGLVILIMLVSVHLFGSLFTVGVMVIPAFITAIAKVDKNHFNWLSIINGLSVIVAFLLLIEFDRLPTTVAILYLVLANTILFSLVKRTARV